MKQPNKLKQVAQRRYYMNKILKEQNIDLDTKTRTIKLPYQCFKDIPIGLRFYIGQCIILQYNVQYEIEGGLKVAPRKNIKRKKKSIKKKVVSRKKITKPPVPVITNQIDLFLANSITY